MPKAGGSLTFDFKDDAQTLLGWTTLNSSMAGSRQHRVKHVQLELATQQVPLIALYILDHTEDRADHDRDAGRVQKAEYPSLSDRSGFGGCSR